MNWAGVARGRWRLAWNTFRSARRGRRSGAGSLLGVALAVVLAALVCAGLMALFAELAAEGATAAETGVALAWVLTAALFGLLVFDLHEAVSMLVVDSDLELLRRAPISGRALALLKLLDALPRTSLLLVVLAVPAVVAYHVYYPLPLWAWLMLPLQLFALWAIPVGLGVLAAIQLLRVVPARRAREALGLLSTLTIFGLWLLNSFLLPRLAETREAPVASLRQALVGSSASLGVSPARWAAGALSAAVSGSPLAALRDSAWLALAAALALGAAAVSAAWQIEAIQSRIASRSRARRATPRARGEPVGPDRPRPLFRAGLAHDALLLFRDWTVLGDVLTAAVLWTLLPLVGAPLYDAPPVALARAMLLALTVGLGYEVAARAIPFEGRGAAWMRLAPVKPWRWIAIKWTGAAAFSAPLVGFAAASVALAMKLRGAQVVEILAVVLPALALSMCVGLWAGAAFGRSDWTQPRGMLTVTGRIWSTGLLLLQAGAWLLLAGLADAHVEALPPHAKLWIPLLLAALVAALPLRGTVRRVAGREWA